MSIAAEIPLSLTIILGWWLVYIAGKADLAIWITGLVLIILGLVGFYLADRSI